MTKFPILVLMLVALVAVFASPLFANLPAKFELIEKSNQVEIELNISGNPFDDMSDREYRHLTGQGQ